MMYFKIFYESLIQAGDALINNKLRTFLSLLGITIGIFCIISVKSAVDSLQENIKSGFSKLGSDVIYVDTRPWSEDPGMNRWKYVNFPRQGLDDLESIQKMSRLAESAAIGVFSGGENISFMGNSISNMFIMGISTDYNKIFNLKIEKGRYFSALEYENARNTMILGGNIAKELFGTIDPIGKSTKLYGQSYTVIGVLEDEGDNLFNFINYDNAVLLGLKNASKFINITDRFADNRILAVKAKASVDLEELKSELTGIIRASRKLKPFEINNFSLNEISVLSSIIDNIFGVINIAGFLIGIFALIVGMFSVANIMFVSVKERTSLIGIKKAIGAKSYMILAEFLIESIILCVIGGVLGLALVYGVLYLISTNTNFEISLSIHNLAIGLFTSIVVGVLSGYIPAVQGSRLDPIEAMRS
jgi:putative ABC transport system permease protein